MQKEHKRHPWTLNSWRSRDDHPSSYDGAVYMLDKKCLEHNFLFKNCRTRKWNQNIIIIIIKCIKVYQPKVNKNSGKLNCLWSNNSTKLRLLQAFTPQIWPKSKQPDNSSKITLPLQWNWPSRDPLVRGFKINLA